MAVLPRLPALACAAVGASESCSFCWQEVGSTRDPNPGSLAERMVGHYFLLINRLLLTQQVQVSGPGQWGGGGGWRGREDACVHINKQPAHFAKTFYGKLALRQKRGKS